MADNQYILPDFTHYSSGLCHYWEPRV